MNSLALLIWTLAEADGPPQTYSDPVMHFTTITSTTLPAMPSDTRIRQNCRDQDSGRRYDQRDYLSPLQEPLG